MGVSLQRRCAVYYLPPIQTGSQWGYIGKAVDPERRFEQHARDSWWWAHVDPRRAVILWYASEAEALQVEKWSILTMGPIFNDQYNGANPYRVERPAHLRPQPAVRQPTTRPVRAPWSPRARRFAGWAATWCVLSLVLWIVAANFTALRWQEAGPASAVGMALFLGWIKPKRRRRGRR